jgi:Tfp pilus assembly protein PilF
VYGPDHPEVAITLNNLGNAQDLLGESEAARLTLQRALAMFEAVYGAEHPQVALTLGNLADTQLELGEDEAARVTLQRALAIEEQQYGPEHPEVDHDPKPRQCAARAGGA